MAAIKILDTHTINKIAAGEVVERPCSVVKELVENSVDAKASSITVEIKNGGVDLIRVTDNGVGIPKDQVEIAFLRHATSKIVEAEDLYEVTSLGFRGEALASIAAVSHVELITKTKEDSTGKRIEVSGGKMMASEEVACPEGTTFLMRHLFYNVPARKAFLSSSGTEAGRISDYMYKLALAHPEIAFIYIQNGKRVFSTSGDHELKHCVLNIYGKEYAKHVYPCFYKQDEITCVGLIGAPSLNRSNRNYEHFFINGRYIKSQILQEAVEAAYKTLVMVGKFPFVILHLKMDPSLVDVNVHPTKLQVRFKNIEHIKTIVYAAVKHTLNAQTLVPDVSIEGSKRETKIQPEVTQQPMDTFFTPRKVDNTVSPTTLLGESIIEARKLPDQNPYKPSTATMARLFGSEDSKEMRVSTLATSEAEYVSEAVEHPDLKDNTQDVALMPADRNVNPVALNKVSGSLQLTPLEVQPEVHQEVLQDIPEAQLQDLEEYRIVGQIFKTYWLVEYHEKVFLIDQHAAHERVLYEQFMRYFKTGKVATQVLLMPETMHLTPFERNFLLENQSTFDKMGFVFELFGAQDVLIREVPYLLNAPIKPAVFKEVLDLLQTQKITHISDIEAQKIITMSCRGAVKGHDALSEKECYELIHALLKLENPFTCPHGRPTIVALKKGDIEKMFKRI